VLLLANFAAVAVFWGVKENCTFSRQAVLRTVRKAVLAVTMTFVWPAVVVCGVAPVVKYMHDRPIL
jgi:hypothetical protein